MSSTRPNIVLVVLDTLRRDVVGCYGETPPWGADFPRIRTPNLDRFAKSAVRFDRAFPEVLPTLPARRALYTGQRVFPFHNVDRFSKGETPGIGRFIKSLKERDFTAVSTTMGAMVKGDFVDASPGWGPIPDEQDTIAEILEEAGYRTALISDLYHQFKPGKNFARGFSQWTFIRGQEADPCRSGPRPSTDEIYRYIPPELIQLRQQDHDLPGAGLPPMLETAASFVRNFYDRHTEADWTSAQVFRAAAQWLDQNRDARETGEGVFLTVECFDPHEMWFVPTHYRKMYDDSTGQDNVLSPYAELEMRPALLRRTRANYAGLVTMVDNWFGALMNALEDGGWLDNTVVAVVSDHGHSMLEHGFMGKRGYPATPDIFAVPFLLRLPGGEHAGTVSTGWVQHHDITATLLDFAAVAPPQPLDGRSVRAAITAGAPQVRDHIVAGWDASVLVATDDWWLSVKANGRGALLYPHDQAGNPAARNVAEDHPEIVEKLYELALEETNGGFPSYILDRADHHADAPGCSPVAALPLRRSHESV